MGGACWPLMDRGGPVGEIDAEPSVRRGDHQLGRRLAIATTHEQLLTMWKAMANAVDVALFSDTPVPVVDFVTEIVVFANESESLPPSRIFGLLTDELAATLTVHRGVFPGVPRRRLRSMFTWAIAVERSALLAPPFDLVGPTALRIGVDLRVQGAALVDDATVAIEPET